MYYEVIQTGSGDSQGTANIKFMLSFAWIFNVHSTCIHVYLWDLIQCWCTACRRRNGTLTKLPLPLVHTLLQKMSYVSFPFIPTMDVTSHLPCVRNVWPLLLVCNKDVQWVKWELRYILHIVVMDTGKDYNAHTSTCTMCVNQSFPTDFDTNVMNLVPSSKNLGPSVTCWIVNWLSDCGYIITIFNHSLQSYCYYNKISTLKDAWIHNTQTSKLVSMKLLEVLCDNFEIS